jgi:hypothetical protein
MWWMWFWETDWIFQASLRWLQTSILQSASLRPLQLRDTPVCSLRFESGSMALCLSRVHRPILETKGSTIVLSPL